MVKVSRNSHESTGCCDLAVTKVQQQRMERKHECKRTANSSLSSLQRCSYTVICLGIHHLLFTSTAITPPPHLTALSAISVGADCLKTSDSGVEMRNMFPAATSVKHIMLHSRYSRWILVSTPSWSIVFTRDLTHPLMMEGKKALSFILLVLHIAPALHPRCLLLSSSVIGGLTPDSLSGERRTVPLQLAWSSMCVRRTKKILFSCTVFNTCERRNEINTKNKVQKSTGAAATGCHERCRYKMNLKVYY